MLSDMSPVALPQLTPLPAMLEKVTRHCPPTPVLSASFGSSPQAEPDSRRASSRSLWRTRCIVWNSIYIPAGLIEGLNRHPGMVNTESLEVPLKGFGATPTRAQVVVENLTTGQRVRRAGVALGAGGVLAVIALPIPLVHFVLVPGALLFGLIFAAMRLGKGQVIGWAEGACPYCGAHQRLALAGRVFRWPREVFCEKCSRPLDLGAVLVAAGSSAKSMPGGTPTPAISASALF